ncbi:metallophosphoesterase family protein [Methanosphaerula subterraneus]|uniref:metallophosphoesterase family protein n=1 Tax=Methanosphaerula subterraneus TaxID=3350244 RepID=UPI003F856C85
MTSSPISTCNETPLKFIHCADLHLDSPFRGLFAQNKRLHEHLSNTTFAAFDSIIDQAIAHNVDFLLIAGDVYDGVDKSLRAQLHLRNGLVRLSREGIQSFIVHGNHDPLNSWSARLRYPDEIHIFSDTPEVIPYKRDNDHLAQVIGVSHPTGSVQKNLIRNLPIREEGWPTTIGLVHCNIGSDTGHQPYAPCKLPDLFALNYDYWALGHIHAKSILHDQTPTVVYAGNPQGRDINEAGPRGCFLVKVVQGQCQPEFLETDTIRWCEIEIRIDGIETINELQDRILTDLDAKQEEAGGRSLICRVTLAGKGPLHQDLHGRVDDLLVALRNEEGLEPPFVWLERITDQTRPPVEREQLLTRQDFIGDLLRFSDQIRGDAEEQQRMQTTFTPLLTNFRWKRYCNLNPSEDLTTLIDEAEAILLDRMLEDYHAD